MLFQHNVVTWRGGGYARSMTVLNVSLQSFEFRFNVPLHRIFPVQTTKQLKAQLPLVLILQSRLHCFTSRKDYVNAPLNGFVILVNASATYTTWTHEWRGPFLPRYRLKSTRQQPHWLATLVSRDVLAPSEQGLIIVFVVTRHSLPHPLLGWLWKFTIRDLHVRLQHRTIEKISAPTQPSGKAHDFSERTEVYFGFVFFGHCRCVKRFFEPSLLPLDILVRLRRRARDSNWPGGRCTPAFFLGQPRRLTLLHVCHGGTSTKGRQHAIQFLSHFSVHLITHGRLTGGTRTSIILSIVREHVPTSAFDMVVRAWINRPQ